ncbi:MAG: T9SS type A sorting domain-containing protein [Spirochaetales bacterium]|nr:T9SS type A sorting domain-containing protein [Spirochaetales bacterium]
MKILFCKVLLFVLFSTASGGEIIKTFTYLPSDILFEKFNGYDVVSMSGAVCSGNVGKPSLPRFPITFVIPPSASIEKVEVIACTKIPIPGEFFVLPAQPFYPISQNKPEFIEPDEVIYSSTDLYPGNIVTWSGTGTKTGYRLCGISVYPVQYYPAERKLILCKTITIRLTYKEGVRIVEPKTEVQLKQALQALHVANPEDVHRFSPPLLSLTNGEIQYLILTEDSLVPYFEPLANWKTKKGVPTAIRTVEWIGTHYSGYDRAEKFRNYEKELFADSGLVWVLIGVDADSASWFGGFSNDIVRGCEAGFIHSICCADLYFSDLDGTWDANGDHVYGDPVDSVDMYSDVYVGRASVDNTLQIITFVEKTLAYEKTPAGSYEQSILLVAGHLFGTYWGDVVCDSIANHIPSGWDINELYQSQGDDLTTLPDVLNEGYGYFESALHGSCVDVHYSNGVIIMDTTDANNLTNAPRYSIGTAISCMIGWFCDAPEYGDCLCEHFMNNSAGGTVAIIGNAGAGWGSSGVIGPSELLDLEFYRSFLDDNVYHAGAANVAARDEFVPLAIDTTHIPEAHLWRVCIYEWNLFGDPELPMRKKNIPDTFSVSCDDSIPVGPQSYTVTVETNGNPVQDALVCVMKGSEVYAYDYTNISGSVTLTIDPVSEGTMDITVTAQDCIPFEGIVYVGETGVAEKPCIQFLKFNLSQNMPNPLTKFTRINYALSEKGMVDISIYDVAGRSIRTLFNGSQEAGEYNVIWDGRKNNGDRVPNGIYFYKLVAGNYSRLRKMIVVK